MKKRQLLTSLFMVLTCLVQAQQGFIEGILIDGASGNPLSFANISVLSPADSALITGGVTEDDGSFRIPVAPGVYMVRFDFISYRPEYRNNLRVEANETVTVETITLASDAEVLQEVEVRAEKSQLEMRMDKKVFNVGKDLASTSGSAQDVLDNIPSVQVDIEGGVSLRGNSGVRILINGRPSGLVGVGNADGLRSLPANLIERVEVITNPSARYEAEGNVGIINIILKQDRRRGLNGAFDLTAGLPQRLGGAFNLNYRTDKLNWFANFGINTRTSPGENYTYQEFYNGDTTNIVEQVGERENTDWEYTTRGGLEYFFNESSILTASITWEDGEGENTSERRYSEFLNVYPDNFTGFSERNEFETEEDPDLEYQITYEKTYNNDREHRWSTVFQHRNTTDREEAVYEEIFRNADGSPSDREDLLQQSLNDEREIGWLLQSDFTLPVGEEGLFEMGYRGSLRFINNDFKVEEWNGEEFEVFPGLTNDFNYDENIQAAYLLFGDKPGRISYQTGLRAEYSYVLTQLETTGEENEQEYWNLFPTAHLTYELNPSNSLQLSYARRIRRPRFWWLNPFFSFADSRNIRRGNPNLQPEFTDAYELSHIKYWDNFNLSSSIYYRHTTRVVQRIQTLVEQDGQLITVSQPENLATEDAYGLEVIFSGDPLEWLNLNANFNFYRSIIDGSNLESELDQDTYTWFARLNSRFDVGEQTMVQFRFNYRAPQETTQGSQEGNSSIDLAISHDFWGERATLTLSARDIYNGRIRISETESPTFYSYEENQWRRRQSLVATFNYRLNQQKRRGGRGGGDFDGGGDDF